MGQIFWALTTCVHRRFGPTGDVVVQMAVVPLTVASRLVVRHGCYLSSPSRVILQVLLVMVDDHQVLLVIDD